MTICDLCYREGKLNEAPETCAECSADMCPGHGEGEFCTHCLAELFPEKEKRTPGELVLVPSYNS